MADLLTEHHDAVQRLAELTGLGADSAQQIIAEVGATAATGWAPDERSLIISALVSAIMSNPWR